MPLRKKLFRTIMEKKAQFFSAWFLIVISSIVFYAFTAAGANLIDNLQIFFNENKVEDAQFMTQQPLNDIEEIEKESGAEIEQRIAIDLPYSKDSTLRLLDETDDVNLSTVVEGGNLSSDRDILVDKGFAKAHDVTIGHEVELGGETFHVTGYMAIPDYIYPLKDEAGFLKNPDAFGVAVVKPSVLSQWENHRIYYSVRLSDASPEELKKQINQTNQIIKWTDKKDNNRISFIKGDIAGVKKMGQFLPIGILFISMVIILILLWRLMKKEYVQIGTLYALGYRKREIIRHYLSYAGVLATTGSVVGTILGWVFLHPLLSTFAAYYNLPVLDVKLHVGYLLVSIFLPLVLFIPFTYYLVHRVLKIPPVSLIKGGERKVKVSRLERLFKMKKLPFRRKFVIREIIRNLPRALFLIIGVMFATLLLLFGFVTKNSMEYLVTDNFQQVYDYEYSYLFKAPQTTEPDSGQIGAVAPFTIDKENVTITGLKPDNTAIRLQDSSREKITFDSVIMNKSLSDKLGIQEGDSIHVKNELTEKSFTLTIDHIAESYLGNMIYMPLDEFNRLNGYPSGSYTEIYSNKELNLPEDQIVSTTKSSDTIDGFKEMIKPLNYGVAAIALVAAIIAIIIIYILISLLIEENSFKISLMKVIGYRENSIMKMMIGYNIWFIILGYVIGIPVTVFSISAFMNSITSEMNVTIPVRLDWMSVFISFSIIIISYYVSLWLNHRKLKGISMKEAINRSTE
ncbi:ABC transporter permease [Bacillus sp. es.034]|uniref:ABC transporter permease n=1 Tax=Bacillus sp. es.034 TaxID=1761763 RepID=UPI000BF8FA11|nr:ABC transporter permease [Bacillus sp. es.034]PFG07489.1 putative ABC transport system permease protein [Bacillus sp. es.034]